MQIFDYLEIDGRQLRILLTIRQAGSLSAAAKMLDMNQSTISYWLDLLRKRTGDPLFVRSGNGVEATERAKALFPIAEEALRQLEAICLTEEYDPGTDSGVLRVSGTAVERDVLISPVLAYAVSVAPNLTFELSPLGSSFQLVEKLRQGAVDLAIMVDRISQGEGIMRRRLFDFEDVVFFDPAHPLQGGDVDAYCARPHVRIAFGPEAGFGVDRQLAKLGKTRRIALQVPDFDSALNLMKDTPIIATLPRHLAQSSARGLASVAPPWVEKPKKLMLYWHARNQTSARHAFWRDRIVEIAQSQTRQPR